MKKHIVIDVLLLLLVLCVAVYAYFGMSAGAFSNQPELEGSHVSTTEATTEVTTEATTETTTEATEETTLATVATPPELTAHTAFIYDVQSGQYLYLLGQEQDTLYPASITKLFTAYVALQYLAPEQSFAAGTAITMVGEDSSLALLEEGNVLTTKQLLAAMLLPSGNDAAYMLADAAGRAIAGDSALSAEQAVGVFVDEMNRQAQSNGMTGTHFTNPDGYHDPDHYTTLADMNRLALLCMDNELIMQYAGMPVVSTVLVSGEDARWENSNALIHPDSEYYCPYVTGLKTGQTEAAGSCLLVSLEIDGKAYAMGIFGSAGHEERFADTLILLSQVFPGLLE